MVVDHQLRKTLSVAIRRLVAGRITNEAFDDLYYQELVDSDDPAIRSIGEFGHGLYSSDVLLAYRLRGRHTLPQETKRIAARCSLFLRTNNAYQWPAFPATRRDAIGSLLGYMSIPLGIAMLVVGGLLLLSTELQFGAILGIAGLLASFAGVWSIYWRDPHESPSWKKWKARGDVEVWPFLRRRQLNAACQSNHLLRTCR